jgi:putative FmdB family regulatory protein
MPIYEYRCHDCHRRVSCFYRSFADIQQPPTCPRCGGTRLTRLISRVSVVRSEESRLDDLADPSLVGDLDENDPKSLARWMRKMSSEVGEEMPEEFDEVIGRLELGQTPEEIEESMPELGESPGGGLDDFE